VANRALYRTLRTARAAENGPQTLGSLRKKTRWRLLSVCAMVALLLADRRCRSAPFMLSDKPELEADS
jgi:hypothetical protein